MHELQQFRSQILKIAKHAGSKAVILCITVAILHIPRNVVTHKKNEWLSVRRSCHYSLYVQIITPDLSPSGCELFGWLRGQPSLSLSIYLFLCLSNFHALLSMDQLRRHQVKSRRCRCFWITVYYYSPTTKMATGCGSVRRCVCLRGNLSRSVGYRWIDIGLH